LGKAGADPPEPLFQRLPHEAGIQASDLTPQLISIRIKEYEGRGELETVGRCQFTTDIVLNVEADDKQFPAGFFFQLVNDGLYPGAGNSIGGLEFEQNRQALPDLGLDCPGVFHQWGLPGTDGHPREDHPHEDHREGDNVRESRLLAEEKQPKNDQEENGNP
jgi:hypothetical protein